MESTIKFSIEQKFLNKRYILEEDLGRGQNATVSKGKDTLTGETKAVKIYQNKDDFKNETKILKIITDINSPYLIKCYESGIGLLSHEEESTETMYSILELGNKGTLHDLILRTKNGFSDVVCKFILLIILNGVEALHKEGIFHGDIKPENIVLCGDNYDLKLCDFGFSAKFYDENGRKKKLKKFKGTTFYAAPEILENKKYDGEKSDIFSIGALLFTLMTKKYMFEKTRKKNVSSSNLYKYIISKQFYKFWSLIENSMSIKSLNENFKNLFVKLVAYNPDERPTIEEIKNHDWMQDVTNATPKYLNNLRKKMIKETAL